VSLDKLTFARMVESAQRFDAIIDDFEAALATLSEVLQHIEEAKSNNRLRVVMLNNTIVALTATIEETLRGLFQEYLSILEESFEDHRKLRQALQKANFECAIQDLRKYKTNEDFKTAAILASNLEKCLTGQP
jgi:2-oxoglutarate dehydrogenase complex dehydrogenase (E1) component-like enzyme